MRRLHSTFLLPLVLLSLLTGMFVVPANAQEYCRAQIENELGKLAIPPERIKKLSIVNIYNGHGQSGGGQIDRVEGWVSFTDCKGNLVIKVNRACLPIENYTTYECHVPGVKNY